MGYSTIESDVEACTLEDNSNYTEVLTLPTSYFQGTSESDIESTLYNFLDCRLKAEAYQDLSSDNFPTFQFQGIQWDVSDDDRNEGLIFVECADKCSNGAICKDIDLQFNHELKCLTKHTCSHSWYDVSLSTYDLKFLDGKPFQGLSQKYKNDVEVEIEKNLNLYVSCRFDFTSDSTWDYTVYGWFSGDKFWGLCYSSCGTRPYCDSLQLRRMADPKDDKCFKKEIAIEEKAEDSRVNTVYEYNFRFNQQSSDGSLVESDFAYNVQSLEENPLFMDYYGNNGGVVINEIPSSEYADQATKFKNLMRDFGYSDSDIADANFNDLCENLVEHVKCDASKTIRIIDIEIQGGNGFKAAKIGNFFGDTLEALILGATLTEAKNFPMQFFGITNLQTLTLRKCLIFSTYS